MHLESQGIVPDISGSTLRLKYDTTIANPAQQAPDQEESKQAEGRGVRVDIQVLKVKEGKSAVKFTYKDT